MKYRYSRKYGHGNAITIEPIPSVGPEANRFRAEIRRITIELYGRGASTSGVVTEVAGGVLFQLQDIAENRKRARAVTKIWRNGKQD